MQILLVRCNTLFRYIPKYWNVCGNIPENILNITANNGIESVNIIDA